MHRLSGLIARFRRDERGAFAVMFGLMAVVLVAIGGAVVDYVTLEQTRNRAQIALDAAALALQPEIFEKPLDEEDIRIRARALLIDRIGEDWNVVVDDPLVIDVNVEDGSLYLRARITVPTIFVSLVGVDELSAQIQSEATRKKLSLEVAMVLDNSGSMLNESRMTYLKEAANCATNTLFFSAVEDDPDNANTCIPTSDAEQLDNVKMAVVPFTMFVNVGTSNSTATWIDQFGASSASNDNFDDDDNDATAFTGTVNRLALFDQLTNENWRGCVEARPHTKTGTLTTEYLDTDDTTPVAADTLFVPHFSPDLPETITTVGSSYQNYMTDHPNACRYTGTCTWTQVKTKCSDYNTCTGTNTSSYSLAGLNKGSLTCTCSATAPWASDSGTGTYSGSGSNRTYTRVRTCSFSYNAQGLSGRELQERICKYNGSVASTAFSNGPNADCTREPILPLTDDPAVVLDTIDDMIAEGGTNIHEGTAWGFRTLSPTLPFAEGSDYEEATSKVMIVMTDGENTAYNLNGNSVQNSIRTLNGSIWYSAYGWPYNARLGTLGAANSVLVTEMNTRTEQTCENAKEAGIVIYTIGLSTNKVSQSTQAVVEAMLTNCASAPENAYFPTSPTELKSVFDSIASQLAALRLAL